MPTPIRILRIDASQDGYTQSLDELRRRLSPDGNVVSERGKQLTQEVFGSPLTPVEVVQRICSEVRSEGDDALFRYCEKLDGKKHTSDSIRVPASLIEESHRNASPEYLRAIRRIRNNILGFQKAILHQDVEYRPSEGIQLRQRYVPLHRIGICVPGGAAAYPSTVLMTAVPAQAAGVDEIVVVAPPTKLGAYNPDVLAACYELGIQEIYAMGGAQGVAALAYGTESVRSVDKIVGPGNLFVALAKKHVYGQVDIDSIAGPSEVVVIADESANVEFAAADMLAQAEHSPGSSVLVTWIPEWIDRVQDALERQVEKLERSALTIDALQSFGAMILVRDAGQACELVDSLAPEHLHIATENPRALLDRIRNSGAAFLGPYSPVALGDYAAGPSHVLPTGGTAKWASGLSANDFLRSGSVIEYSRASLEEIAPDIQILAEKEGLTAHRNSVTIRVNEKR